MLRILVLAYGNKKHLVENSLQKFVEAVGIIHIVIDMQKDDVLVLS